MKCWRLALTLWVAFGCGASALAHRGSESHLAIDATDARISGQWDIDTRDLAAAAAPGAPTEPAQAAAVWLAARPGIAGSVLGRLQLAADGAACRLDPAGQRVAERDSGQYLEVRFHADCGAAPRQLEVDYRLLFDTDPRHLGLMTLQVGGQIRAAVFTAQSPRQTFTLREPSLWEHAAADLRSGVWHIWTGFDHLLFLLCLLLPSVLHKGAPGLGARAVVVEVLGVVTAFTLAHSITLSLAALRVLTLPVRFTESVIALSVLVAAVLNIRPVPPIRRWQATFGFGLIHGFGFASALTDLAVSGPSLAATLAAFNLGVEIGQLALVCVALPLAYFCARHIWYERMIVKAGSAAAGLVALLWFAERALSLRILPTL
jgi:hypothetical protein